MLAWKAFAIIFCKYFHSPLKTLVIFHFLHLIVTVKENKPARSAQAVNTVMHSGCLIFHDPSFDRGFVFHVQPFLFRFFRIQLRCLLHE